VAPHEIIKQYGAEILRLWVSAQNYQDDVRISPVILTQLVDAYRKIRNTCRFLLSNLYDFDPSKHQIPYEQLPELDRWALMRLSELIPRVKQSYEAFEFHTIFHALNNFCSVDLSAVYLDILKDRLYTFRADSQLRRGSQTVFFEIVTALTKLMAPVLSFTAEEIWRTLVAKTDMGVGTTSVHLSQFPEAHSQWQDANLAARWDRLLSYRDQVQAVLEGNRREKVIGSSLEASVELRANAEDYAFLKSFEGDLPTVFIVSQVILKAGRDANAPLGITAAKSPFGKCERCWNYREAVGKDATHPTLCDRCVEAIR
jgi:isoleucyl-tRNA synthetase